MAESVYRSAQGRAEVEGFYRRLLDSFPPDAFERLYVPSTAGSVHLLRAGGDQAPALVLLHGSMSNSAAWLGILNDYSRDFRVHCVDIPGEPGLSAPERLPLDPDTAALWLASVLDALGIASCALLGMSLGSWYALSFATRFPRRVRALSMLTASGLAPQRTSFIFKALFCMAAGAYGKRMLNRIVYHRAAVPREVLDFQSLVSAHFRPVMEVIPLFSDDELRALGSFAVPVQYFGGDRDALLDTRGSAARLRALVPGAEINLLEDTGHVVIDRFHEAGEFCRKAVML